MYLNKAILIGNLTRDPELRSLPSGVQVANMGVATNRIWKDKNGSRQESTDYHNVVVFGRQAETTAQYLRKGSSVLIEGRIQTRSWESSDGKKNYRTEVVADRVQFGPRSAGAASANVEDKSSVSNESEGSDISQDEQIDYPEENVNVDDIPF